MMEEGRNFDALIIVTPADCRRLLQLYPRLIDNYPYGRLGFIGAPEVGEIAKGDDRIKDNVFWIDENDLVSFDEVNECLLSHIKTVIGNEPLSRGVTGWYYQQFLKMQYTNIFHSILTGLNILIPELQNQRLQLRRLL